MTDGLSRRPDANRLPVYLDLAGLERLDAEDRPRKLRPAGTLQPGEAHHLPGPDLEVDVPQHAPGSIPNPQTRLPDILRLRPPRAVATPVAPARTRAPFPPPPRAAPPRAPPRPPPAPPAADSSDPGRARPSSAPVPRSRPRRSRPSRP